MANNVLAFEFLGVDRFSGVAEHIGKKMDGVGQHTKTLGDRLSGFGKFAGTALLGVGAGMTALVGAGAFMGVKTAADLEQAQIGFSTLLGSAKEAQTFLKDMIQFANTTPFELQGLLDAARGLLGVGFSAKQAKVILQDYGDAASALGIKQDAFQRIMVAVSQSWSSGKISLQDMNQLANNGIPVWQLLSKALGKPVPVIRTLIAHGKLLSHDVLPKLQGEMRKDYGGAMVKQSQTLSGLWSTFMDTLRNGLAVAIKPMIPALKVGLAGAIAFVGVAAKALPLILNAVTGAIGFLGSKLSVFKELGHNKVALIAMAGAIGALVVPALVGMAVALSGVAVAAWAAIAPFLPFIAIGAALGAAAYLIVTNWERVSGVFKFITPIIGTVVHYFRDMLMPALREAAARVFPAIQGAIASVAAAFKDHQDVIRDFGKVFMFILKALGVALAVLAIAIVKVVIPVIAKLLVTVLSVVGPIVRALLSITGVLLHVITGIASFAVNVSKAIARVAASIVNAFSTAGRWLLKAGQAIISGLVNGVTAVWPHIVIAMKHTIDFLLFPFRPALTWLFRAGGAVLTGLIRGAQSVWHMVTSWISDRIARIIAFYAPAARWLVGAGANLLRGLVHGLGSMISTVTGTIRRFITRNLIAPFTNAGKWLLRAGGQLIGGLLGGVGNALKNIGSWINDHVVQPIIKAVRWFFGISSPSTVMMGIGGHLMSGLIAGLVRHNPVKFIGKIFGGMPAALGAIVGKGLQTIAGLPKKALDALGSLGADVQSALGMAGGVPVQGGGNAANRQLGQKMASYYGWTGNQWAALNNLWMGESGWNNLARNSSSGAFGIPQALPPGKMGAAAAGGNAAAQIAWGLSYIRSVYGSPANAYSMWLKRSPHWYDEGGLLRGKGLFGKNTGADERVLSPRQTKWFERAMAMGARSGGSGVGHGGVTVVLNAPNYVGNRNELLDEFNRLARLGRLDAIVRMASR